MIGRILVGLGGSAYSDCPTHVAIDLAKRYGAQLTGVTVVDLDRLRNVGPVPIGAGAVATELRDHRMKTAREHIDAAVDAFTSDCEKANIDFRVLREEKDEPFHCLIGEARYHDLAVFGLQGLFEYDIEGEPAYDPADALMHLIRGGVRPLLAVGGEEHAIKRVLIAYNGSIMSAKTMKRFAQHKLWPEAKLKVVAFDEGNKVNETLLKNAEEYLRIHNFEVETALEQGDPRKGITEAANAWDADMIVMGSSEHSVITRRVMGDVLADTVRQTDLPLFLGQ